jgi:hypothetical protein
MEAAKLYKIDKWKYFDLIGYKPHPKQALFHKSDVRFKVPVCGRRFGKTAMGARDLEPVLMTPNRRVWIVGPTYDLGEKEFRVIWHDMIIKLGLGKEKTVKRSYAKKQGDLSIEFPWGTRLEVRSADRPENLVGEGLDYVIMSEAAKHTQETWDRFIRPALTDRKGSATFSTTPEGQNWIYRLWKMGRDPNEPDFASWQFPSWDNPYVYPGGRNDPEILLTERTTPAEVFRQEYAADFTSFSGRIYSDFDEQTHVQHVQFNPLLPNYIAFDWGFVDAMAAIEFQVDSMQRVRIWREHYKTRMRLKDYLAELKARPQPEGYRLDLCFGDAADPEAVISVSEDFSPCYADPLSKTNWREGIELVQGFLKLQETGEMDEYGTPEYEPWLLVDHSCANLIREFNNYRAMEPPKGKDRNAREAAVDYDNHALDALRYGLMHVFKLGATHSLSEVLSHAEMTNLPSGGYFTSGMRFS